jgi:catechol 2,3-dioxygenase-like lactoylglutathione lyase family enzyme
METFSLPCLGEHRPLRARAAKLAIAALLFAASLSASAAVREVGAIGLTVGDLDREVEFFTKVLSFEKVSEAKTAVGAADDLLGLNGTQLRTAELRLGGERITLTEHLTGKGRPIPADSRSFDRWFQHLAIVVRDMDKAYERLRAHKVKHVSTAPQTLPAWNKDAGGIKAFYFHDPEEHVLEIIWFPPDKGDPKWQPHAAGTLPAAGKAAPGGEDAGNTLFLGIDHTAIVVSDTDRSLAFYRDVLGMKVAGGAENYGVEQEHLNQVFGARLRITALRAERGPGIEFLEYIAPPGGRPLPADAKANDLVFWRTRIAADALDELATQLRHRPVNFVSARVAAWAGDLPKAARSVIVRDPDGHALQLIDPRSSLGREALTSQAGRQGVRGP